MHEDERDQVVFDIKRVGEVQEGHDGWYLGIVGLYPFIGVRHT